MRGRESRSGGPNSADLLVCFPSRAHLTLMPKAICSPVRPCETSRRHNHRHSHSLSFSVGELSNKSHLKRSRTRGSPLLWAKRKGNMGEEMEEPTSPKVTCAGQIRVRPKAGGGSCKNWQSVMEEIERIHKKGRQKKKPSWMEALGFKKEVMHFLTCLRSLRLDFRCFGSLPAGADITSDEDEEEEVGHVDDEDENDESSRTVFSKWFMVLQENQNEGFCNVEGKGKIKHDDDLDVDDQGEEAACVPPPNALSLMRCRSAPAKSWLEEKEEKNENEDEEKGEEDEEKKKENLMLMKYDTDYYKISADIAKETWVVGDALSRSRSWKR